MYVLVINAGSSSLKYQLVDMTDESVLTSGLVERIGSDSAQFTSKTNGNKQTQTIKISDHNEALDIVTKALTAKDTGVIKSMDEISAVGHRITHGGDKFTDSVLIDDEVLDAIKDNIELAPLHNPANIMGVEACMKIMPGVPMVAVFDTAFHQSLPKKAYLYGLPYEAYSELKIRRYGFHGTSHKYIARRMAKIMGKDVNELKIVTCHLGNGASVAAVKNGKSIDTSMGFTPLEGLVMGTRCGDIDPSIADFLMLKLNYDNSQINEYFNKKSGVLGISGKSNDFRDLFENAKKGDERSKIAMEVYCYRVQKYIGAYAAAMGGIDAIAFSAGIGENARYIREMIMEDLEFLGAKLDLDANDSSGVEKIISTPDSKVTVAVVLTNEELMIARDTYRICG